MRSAISYLRRLAAWLWQGCHLFSGPLLAIGMPLIPAWLFPSELGFRSIGFLLQVLGVWIVWLGIRGTREQFELPSSVEQTKAWLANFPRLRGRTVFAGGAVTAASVVGSARGYAWFGAPENATLEQRVDTIEKNLRRVRDALSAQQSEADQRDSAQKEDLKRERTERETADKEIHDKIKETETGGLKLNAAGVWWLLSGTICSTFPEEIARMVGAPD